MRRNIIIYISGLLLLLSAGSCVSGLFPKSYEEGDGIGNIVINISNGPDTKAPLTAPEDDKINHLVVWLAKDGTVIRKQVLTPGAQSTTVVFSGIQRGPHDIYIVANRSDLAGSYDSDPSGIAALTNLTLDVISDRSAPSYDVAAGVPAALKTSVYVAPGDNIVSAELIRAVGRLTIEFRNLIEESDPDWDYDLYVGDVHLSKRNQSNGYLFPGDGNISHPGTFTELDFPALSGVIKIPYNTSAVVFDQYLYETAVSLDPLKLAFATGIYKSNTPASNVKYEETTVPVTTYTFGPQTTSISTGSQQYLIRSATNSQLYLGVNAAGNGLIAKEFSDEVLKADPDINNFLWTFESGYKIKSVKNGQYVTLDADVAKLGDTGTSLGTNTSSGRRFRIYSSGYKYLAASSNSIISSPSSYSWYVRTVSSTSSTKTIMQFTSADKTTNPDNFHDIQYINKYGEPVPLTHINRNEHINLTINVYYHIETGAFEFRLLDWENKDNSTTFD